jgi:anti-sigma factor RsiW
MRERRTRRGLACPEVVELVTAYLDDALGAADRVRFEAHLETCADCTTYVAQFIQTMNALGALPGEAPDEQALAALLGVFRDVVGER